MAGGVPALLMVLTVCVCACRSSPALPGGGAPEPDPSPRRDSAIRVPGGGRPHPPCHLAEERREGPLQRPREDVQQVGSRPLLLTLGALRWRSMTSYKGSTDMDFWNDMDGRYADTTAFTPSIYIIKMTL